MIALFKPKRIPGNSNLRYSYADTYDGYPLMMDKGLFVEQYLEKLHQTLQYALSDYARGFAFRFDLRLPSGKHLPDDAVTSRVIQRFKVSLDAQIRHGRERARRRNRTSHDSCVKLFWVREVGQAGRPHYLCIEFLNRDAYRSLGPIKSECKNMYNRLELAWASALQLPVDEGQGAVHIPRGHFPLSPAWESRS